MLPFQNKGAVINKTHVPTRSEDLPAPLCDLAIEVSCKKEGKSEEDVIREFSEKLTFRFTSSTPIPIKGMLQLWKQPRQTSRFQMQALW